MILLVSILVSSSRFGFVNVPSDEVMIHPEESNSNEVEGDVHSMTQSNSLLIGGPERTHCSVLYMRGGAISSCTIPTNAANLHRRTFCVTY